ncbi:hypothetical protein PgNI_06071 [Pyricularia grisea]|uniref:Mid2 domain-containing protein n=1 Tax=Pyricularia grisea TaxID=148305 RepID=A0A6P8B7M5_PYRGI|nr:hypothetical protein PgNI_06071 [Pyricularia grisea]TLD11129.1 hypothetical protein PgNI_06071 [Pyricularia grisea]
MINPETTTQLRLLLLFSCLFAALHGTMASAVAMPPATGSVVIPLDAQSPRPTEAPIMVELARRQSPFTYIVAPDGICGWNSQNTDNGPVIIKNIAASFGSAMVLFQKGVVAALQRAARTGTLPYCNTYFFGSYGRYPAFTCGSTNWTEPSVYYMIKPGTERFFATSTTLATLLTATATSDGSVVTQVVTVAPTGSTNGGAGEGDGNSSVGGGNSQPSSSGGGGGGGGGEQPSNGANTGAIIGGAVGGAAVLAISALAAVLLYRRRKKNKRDATGASAGAQGDGFYPMSPSQPDSTAFTPSSYNTPGIPWPQQNCYSVSSASPLPTSPPNAPHYDRVYPKYPAPMAEVDSTGQNRVHELGTN